MPLNTLISLPVRVSTSESTPFFDTSQPPLLFPRFLNTRSKFTLLKTTLSLQPFPDLTYINNTFDNYTARTTLQTITPSAMPHFVYTSDSPFDEYTFSRTLLYVATFENTHFKQHFPTLHDRFTLTGTHSSNRTI